MPEQPERRFTDRQLQALLLNAIPPDGTTLPQLATELLGNPKLVEAGLDMPALEAGLNMVVSLSLVEKDGQLYRPTAFTQKAMKMFRIA
jgi:hypothetical protein